MADVKPPGKDVAPASRRRGRRLPGPVTEGEGRSRVKVRLHRQGRDLVAVVTGGEAHVGAVAVYAPRTPGTGGDDRRRETRHGLPALAEAFAAVNIVPGHREGPLAEKTARQLGQAVGSTCVAVVGIHQDEASPDEIAAIVANVRLAVQRLVIQLESQHGDEKG